MKNQIEKLIVLVLIALSICSCHKEQEGSIDSVNGLSIYWHHVGISYEGRYLLFVFYEIDSYINDYELIFSRTINDDEIVIKLEDKELLGECKQYPGWEDPDLCTPSGGFRLYEQDINKLPIKLTVQTPNFSTTAILDFSDVKYTLDVQEQDYLSCNITEVYPIPPNILYGYVSFRGEENRIHAENFFNDMEELGFEETSVPNYPYRYLSVSDNGIPEDYTSPPDNYGLGFMYTYQNNFNQAYELAEQYYNSTSIHIDLFGSNGHEAHFK